MEPRLRAAKNVGKMNFSHAELTQLLIAHGDVNNPLPDSIRVLDEIVTDFIQGVALEATRAASYSGRQKVKLEDFEFAFRKSPLFLGKVQEVFEKKGEIDNVRKILRNDEDVIMKNAVDAEKKGAAAPASSAPAPPPPTSSTTTTKASAHAPGQQAPSMAPSANQTQVKVEEELGEDDDDIMVDEDIGR